MRGVAWCGTPHQSPFPMVVPIDDRSIHNEKPTPQNELKHTHPPTLLHQRIRRQLPQPLHRGAGQNGLERRGHKHPLFTMWMVGVVRQCGCITYSE